MRQSLGVLLFGKPAGVVSIEGELRSPEDWEFAYDAGYLSASRTPLSVSMPLREAPYKGAVVRNWFTNLLPEGQVRAAVCDRLRVPQDDDFALLEAIGGECAGAVSIGDRAPSDTDEELDLETMLYLQGGGEGAWATLAAPHRLSLAGAQDKIAVVRLADGTLRLPGLREPSTHILKPESNRFHGLRDYEAFGLRLARNVGLNVASVELTVAGGRKAILVERFDRERTTDGQLLRLHQEDFCQALGYPSRMKYEDAGGPSLARISELIRKHALGAASLRGLLEWVIFNVLIGNADAHAKNLSLLYADNAVRMAPFYDLVPTIVYPESRIERMPALKIGGATGIDTVAFDDWTAFASATGFRARYVVARVLELAGRVIEEAPHIAQTLVAEGGEHGYLVEKAVPAVIENAARTRDAILKR